MVHPVQVGKRTRMSFGKIKEVAEMPNLIEVQLDYYNWFLKEGLDEVFTGPTAVAFSNEDVVAPAKIMDEFAKEAKALEIKGGIIEGKVASLEEIHALAKLPNREGLLSMLLSVLQAPVRNVAYAVKAVAEKNEEVA